jgi:hypothetical protein
MRLERVSELRMILADRLSAEPNVGYWARVKSRFAVEFGLSERKVNEWTRLLCLGGFVDIKSRQDKQ